MKPSASPGTKWAASLGAHGARLDHVESQLHRAASSSRSDASRRQGPECFKAHGT